ncbi:MAG: DotD/TraH family lipoprotein [Alphaproteobacteria bacterium]|nr:DotD/TraH family lipoprotein [Alphaproteobacteria bacterium]
MPPPCAAVLRSLLALLLAGSLAGCVSWGPEAAPAAVAPSGPDPAEERLIEAAERAERALASLARSLPAPDLQSGLPDADTLPAALRRPVSLDWSGPIETLAATLARLAGYRFGEAGRPPARPLIVAVEAENEPLIAVLRDVGLRAGGAATLTVDAANQTVLLDWSSRVPGEDG